MALILVSPSTGRLIMGVGQWSSTLECELSSTIFSLVPTLSLTQPGRNRAILSLGPSTVMNNTLKPNTRF